MTRQLCFLFFCLLLHPTFAQKTDSKSSPVVFSYSGKNVTADEFLYLYNKNNRDKKEEYTQPKIEEYLGLLINFKLKVEEARHRGMDTVSAFVREYNGYREELRKPYLPDAKLIDSLVLITYNRLKEEVRAAHILLNLKADATPEDTTVVYNQALELRKRILSGEDFSKVAAVYSQEPNAAMTKGDLGYFTALQMVFPFEQAAFTTPVGQVSMPVRTRFGYHLVNVLDRRPSRGEVEVSHLMLRTGEGFDNDKAKNTIFELYDQLQKGASWSELVKEHSQDPSSKDNGGKLRPFGSGTMASVPTFEQAAFDLKNAGDMSDPVQTQFGWHIIKLERKIPLPQLSEMEASLKNRVSRDERAQLSRQAIQQRMRTEFKFMENNDVKAQVLALADSSLLKGKWKPNVNGSLANSKLFSMRDKNYTAASFIDYVKLQQRGSSGTPSKVLAQLYDKYVETVQGELFEEKIKSEHPEYRFLLQEYYEGILLFEIMEKEVWNKAANDSVGQADFFKINQSQYQAKERVEATIYAASSKEIQEELAQVLNDSSKREELIKSNKVRVEKGRFEKAERPVFAKIPWSEGIHKAENNNTFYVVKAVRFVPPGQKTFEEARAAVISDYQNELEKRWLTELKKRYPVKVNKKGKKYVIDQLLNQS